MSITLNSKTVNQEIQTLVEDFLKTKEIQVITKIAKGRKGYAGSKHLGKASYMKGNRRAA